MGNQRKITNVMDEEVPRVRTSLEDTSSGFTADQIAERSLARCLEAFDRYGLVLISLEHPCLTERDRHDLIIIMDKLRVSLNG